MNVSLPLLARLRHAVRLRKCPVTEVDRKWPTCGQIDANDLKQSRTICADKRVDTARCAIEADMPDGF